MVSSNLGQWYTVLFLFQNFFQNSNDLSEEQGIHNRIAKQTQRRELLLKKKKEQVCKEQKDKEKKDEATADKVQSEEKRAKAKEIQNTEEYFMAKEDETRGFVANLKSTYQSTKAKFFALSASAMQVLLNFEGN